MDNLYILATIARDVISLETGFMVSPELTTKDCLNV